MYLSSHHEPASLRRVLLIPNHRFATLPKEKVFVPVSMWLVIRDSIGEVAVDGAEERSEM